MSALIEKRWLNAKEAGQYLGYSDWSIRSFCKRGLLKHSKLPGTNGGFRFQREWLDEFLNARAVAPRGAIQVPAAKPAPTTPTPLKVFGGSERFAAAVEKIRAKRANDRT